MSMKCPNCLVELKWTDLVSNKLEEAPKFMGISRPRMYCNNCNIELTSATSFKYSF